MSAADNEHDLTPRVLSFGALDPEVQKHITEYLGSVGIDYRSFPTLGVNETLSTEQSFADIKSPDDYIFREGFEDFQRTHRGYSAGLVTSLFSTLVESRSDTWRHQWLRSFGTSEETKYVPEPQKGIVVKSRAELGVLPYGPKDALPTLSNSYLRLVVDFAIQAGSIIEASRPLVAVRDSGIERLVKALNRHDRAFIYMSESLLQNFES